MNKSTKAMIMPVAVLVIICIVISGALALTNSVTEPIITAAEQRKANEALFLVVPDADLFEEVTGVTLPANVTRISKAKNGAGFAIEVKGTPGYGGDIIMAVGITPDGKIIKGHVISHQETNNLGSRVAEPEFGEKLAGMDSSLNGYSMIGGVTVSSTAYKNGLMAAFAAYDLVK